MPSTSTFTVYSMGFFFYPYRTSGDGQTTVPIIAAPSVHAHIAAVVVIRRGKCERIPFKGSCRIRIEPGRAFRTATEPGGAAVRRARLINGVPPDSSLPGGAVAGRTGGESASPWENFDMVPDVSTLSGNLTLRPGWRDQLVMEMECHGGELTAIPDNTTTAKKWIWPNGHRQVVTGLCRYRVPVGKGTMWVGTCKVPIDDSTRVVLLHIADKAQESDYQRYLRGLAHHVAMLSLCEPETSVGFSNPLDFETMAATGTASDHEEYRRYVARAIDFVRKSSGESITARVLEAGYPSCNGRRMKI